MSIWRVDRIVEQTRALAEAAAKTAGPVLRGWLDRATALWVKTKTLVAPDKGGLENATARSDRELPAIVEQTRALAEAVAKAAGPVLRGWLDRATALWAKTKTLVASGKGGRGNATARSDRELPADDHASPEPEIATPAVADAAGTDPATDTVSAHPGSDEAVEITVTPRRPLTMAAASSPLRRALARGPLLATSAAAVLLAAALVLYAVDDSPQSDSAPAAQETAAPTAAASSVPASGEATESPKAEAPPPAAPAESAGEAAASPPAEASPPAPSAEAQSATGTSAPPIAQTPAEPAPEAEQAAAPPRTGTSPAPTAQKPAEPAPEAQQTAAPPESANPPAPAPAQTEIATAPAAKPAPATLPRPPVGPSLANLGRPERPGSAVAAAPPQAEEPLSAVESRARAGDSDAQVELARRYVAGAGVARNEAEAARWLERAAEQGNAQAQFNLAVMYERGIGVAASQQKAIDLYRRASEQNSPMALHNLALIYGMGTGIATDPVKAWRLMSEAADLGQMESQYSLALMYVQGIGVQADKAVALSWLALAARPNQPRIIEAARQLASELSDAERQRARDLAEGHVRRINSNRQKLATAKLAPAASVPEPSAGQDTLDAAGLTEIQELLTTLKLYGGRVDGAAGPLTAQAIRKFQAMAGLEQDGQPTRALLETLRERVRLASSRTPPATP